MKNQLIRILSTNSQSRKCFRFLRLKSAISSGSKLKNYTCDLKNKRNGSINELINSRNQSHAIKFLNSRDAYNAYREANVEYK